MLSDFIKSNSEKIISEWEAFARTLPAAQNMNRIALRDHSQEILNFIARDIESNQTASQQSKKSKGLGPEEGGSKDSAAQTHAKLRSESGFDMVQMASEYRALRASIIKLWTREWIQVEPTDLSDLIRFNEAIDQALMESVISFKEKVEYSKDMFIGILSHDLRNPLGAIATSCELLLAKGGLSEEQVSLASQIETSTKRISQMIADLMDLTRITLGTGIPISVVPMDIGVVAKQAVDEIQAFYPDRVILFIKTGNLEGTWDNIRILQIFSNLIGNAVKYGMENSPISVTITGKPEEITIEIHNEGKAIPPDKMSAIFDSFTRIVKEGEKRDVSTGLGLGLYIAKEIVIAHGGKIAVTSSEKEGTIFTVRLPRIELLQQQTHS